MTEKTFDIIIIGGGLTGLLTAFTLSQKNLNIALIDKNDFTNQSSISADFRSTAISEGSKIFFEKIDIWKNIKSQAQNIKYIRVYDREISNKIDFVNSNKKSYLEYNNENKLIKKVLLNKNKLKKNIKIFSKNKLKSIQQLESIINCKTQKNTIKSKLLIAADGKNSFIRSIIKTNFFSKLCSPLYR